MDEIMLQQSRKALSSISSNHNNHASQMTTKREDPPAKVVTQTPPLPRPIPRRSPVEVPLNHNSTPELNRVAVGVSPRERVAFERLLRVDQHSNAAFQEYLPFTPIVPKKSYRCTPMPTETNLNQSFSGDLEALMNFLDEMSFGPSPSHSTLVGSGIIAAAASHDGNSNEVSPCLPINQNQHDSLAVNLPSEASILKDHHDVNEELLTDDWKQPIWTNDAEPTRTSADTQSQANAENHQETSSNQGWEERQWLDSMEVIASSEITTLRDSRETEAEFTDQYDEEEKVWDNSMEVNVRPDASSLRDNSLELSKESWERWDHLQKQSHFFLEDAMQEREWIQQWAEQMKQAVVVWAQQQRALIEHERQALGLSIHNSTPPLILTGDSGVPPSSIAFSKDSRGNSELRQELNDLRSAFESATLGYEKEKDHLQSIIQQQTKKILELEKQLAATSSSQNEPKRSAATPDPEVTEKSNIIEKEKRSSEETNECNPLGTTIVVPTWQPRLAGSPTLSRRTRKERSDGCLVVTYRNGTCKETYPDGTCTIRFPNGDIQTTYASTKTWAYYHATARTIQVCHTDGSHVFEFPNQQVERHFPDGRVMVRYPDGTKTKQFTDGTVETTFPDGIHVLLEHPDGKRELRELSINSLN